MDAIGSEITLSGPDDLRGIKFLGEWSVNAPARLVTHRPSGLCFEVRALQSAPADGIDAKPWDYAARLSHKCDGKAAQATHDVQRIGMDALHAWNLATYEPPPCSDDDIPF